MYSGMFSSFFRIYVFSLAMLFILQVSAALAAPATTGGAEFDIPISELNIVKKKTPVKRATSESKKKKKSDKRSDKKSHKSSLEVADPNKPVGQTKEIPVEPDGTANHAVALKKSPDADKPSSKSENSQIHHTPYSFVVTGKRTVIHAVINSKNEIQDVNCSLAVTEGGAQTLVKMVKVDGTRFTYMATLPGLPPGSPSLRYTIISVDLPGKETRSQEYVTPVMSSPVVPSWQLEKDAAVSVEPTEEKTPLKNLSGQ